MFAEAAPLEEDAFITSVKDRFPSLVRFVGVADTLKHIRAARRETAGTSTGTPRGPDDPWRGLGLGLVYCRPKAGTKGKKPGDDTKSEDSREPVQTRSVENMLI